MPTSYFIEPNNNVTFPLQYQCQFENHPTILSAPVNAGDATNKSNVDSQSYWTYFPSSNWIVPNNNVTFHQQYTNQFENPPTILNTPTNSTDAVNKFFVDNLINQLCTLNSLVNPLTSQIPVQPPQTS